MWHMTNTLYAMYDFFDACIRNDKYTQQLYILQQFDIWRKPEFHFHRETRVDVTLCILVTDTGSQVSVR